MAANDSATLCANNCGFYGNPKNHNLCSLCFAAFLKQQITRTEIRNQEPDLGTGGSESSSETCEPTAGGKNRCRTCKKKVGLLGFKCRCGDWFCGKHRYPEEHSCGVDRKAVGRQVLATQIVRCKADKLEFRV